MADAVATALPWLDAKKHQAIAELATALQAPETAGTNIWTALKQMAGNLMPPRADTGDPVQNSRNLMMGFGTAPLGIVKFPGGPPIPPRYEVSETSLDQLHPTDLAKIRALRDALFEQEQAKSGDVGDFWNRLYPDKFQVGDSVVHGNRVGRIIEGGKVPWIRFADGTEGPVPQGYLKKPTIEAVK